MSKNQRNRGLGRGLSALMADVNADQPSVAAEAPAGPRRPDLLVPVEKVVPNPDQPRRTFTQAQLDELAASIKEKGIIQPLIVRERGETYEIVAGERRWRAAQIAKLHEIPVLLRDYDDTEVLEVAIIENIQRADLNPVEEAAGYRQLMDRFGHTQEKLAEALGKSRSYIANLLRLLNLPTDVQDLLKDGKLSAGHARALITADNPSVLAAQVIAGGLSVRETEKLANQEKPEPKKAKTTAAPEKDADTRALEGDLSAALGMNVTINHPASGDGGTISIRYKDLDQLDELCRILSAAR
ncbi:chromosome partitioning protein, ParB family [Pseudooceanicola nitratireducens]|uniref:Chromosome partitioning protein, ParB family n=1 Tax=Pseudooceanicola nitratireducens TaxID=517719 RepID=A0A1I1H9I8_9RHOB|nr:ParB/RepB/Spo0J family partition protein [Pseudooceanicola nitratireducens]SEJ09961.1 chromosome partitioning protein, ParB family [Pseudooceanicola nitratireducens]SFC20375.1 chromosome partitioning protein, ParB family [Pseudooceanicola nitratireducens]